MPGRSQAKCAGLAACSAAGGSIATAYVIWVARPALAPAIAARLRPLTTLFENKWYFDELIDALVVRPGAWFGRFAQTASSASSSTAF